MALALAVVPLLGVIALTAWLRRPAHLAACAGVLVTVLIAVAAPWFRLPPGGSVVAVGGALLLAAEAALVIIPGLYLNEVLARRNVQQRLADWVRGLPLPAGYAAALVVTGFAPALESLTGFGVSLLVTVPVLLALAPRPVALRQAVLGMNIMPWGTLALATVVGAGLAGLPVSVLGTATAWTSCAVFPVMGMAAAALGAPTGARRGPVAAGAALGLVTSAGLLGGNALGVTELAGLLAGTVTSALALLLLRLRGNALRPPWSALAPYGLALALVLLLRLLVLGVRIDRLVLRIGDTAFAPLTSPGIALALTALLAGRGLSGPGLRESLGRARKPLLALAGFTVMAALMTVSGMVGELGGLLAAGGIAGAVLLSPLLGMVSGYLTGSGTGGNALMMRLQSSIGRHLGSHEVFAAVQNSAAGHAVFASMPIILTVLAIAGNPGRDEEQSLIRFGLAVLGGLYLVFGATAAVLTVCWPR